MCDKSFAKHFVRQVLMQLAIKAGLLCGAKYKVLLLILLGICHQVHASQIHWQPCEERPDSLFECATVYVPVNHQQHSYTYQSLDDAAEVVGIALARLPARDGDNEKGSLFLNPGGPGSSGVDQVFNEGMDLYQQEIGNSYDIIGFDPRGVARSEQLSCFEDMSELLPVFQRPPFPVIADEINQHQEVDEYIAGLCASRAGNLINHMSTADVARDLDLLRKAVGDKTLNFFGRSYGSFIGVTYANLFPKKVGAMVLDSVIDPVARATGRRWQSYFLPFSTRQKSAVGGQDTLNDFFRVCDEVGVQVCPFAGNAASRFDMIVERLRLGPVTLTLPDGSVTEADYPNLIVFADGSLRDTNRWPTFALILTLLDAAIRTAAEMPAAEQGLTTMTTGASLGANEAAAPLIPQPRIASSAFNCADTNNPYFYEYWPWAADYAAAKQGYFGRFWTWTSSLCHVWPGSRKSRYKGNFRVHTKNPVLLTHTILDPTTPYSGAKKVKRLLWKSRLLTINGWGHTTLSESSCARQLVSDYLVKGTLPKKGAVCDQDFAPFGARFPLDKSQPSIFE